MAFPTDSQTSTSLAVFIPEIWGQKVNDFFKSKLVMARFFIDRSDELAGGGDTLYTPNLSEMTAYAKSNATAVTLNNTTETKIDLTVDQWYEVSFAIEDKEAAQVMHSYYLQERYAKNAGYTIAKALEVDIAELFADFGTTVGSSSTDVADSIVRSAIATMEAANYNVNDGDCAFFFDPSVFWNQLQSIDKFSLAVNAPVNDPVAKRPDGHLYGVPVYLSTNIQYVSGSTGRNNALAHRDAIHFATSPLGSGGSLAQTMVGSYGVRVQSNYIPEYLSTLTTADMLWGVIENRDDGGVCIASSE